MISAYIQVNEGRAKLIDEHEKLNNSQTFDLAKTVVDEYISNQSAFNELMHYQETGEILGLHPIFDEDNLKAEIEALPDVEAFKRYKNIASRISRLRNKIKKNPNDAERKRKLKRTLTERDMLQNKLNEKQIL